MQNDDLKIGGCECIDGDQWKKWNHVSQAYPYGLFQAIFSYRPNFEINPHELQTVLDSDYLSEREKTAIFAYYKDGKTLKQIGEEYFGVTQERVRQLRDKALRKLRNPKVSKRFFRAEKQTVIDISEPVHCGCGGVALVDSWLGGLHQANVYYVHCERCDAKTTNYFTEIEAVSAWNTAMGITHEKAVDYLQTTGWMRWHDREIATSEQSTGEWIPIPAFENMRCSNCRTVYGANLYPRNFCPRCGASMKGEYSR